MPLVRDLKSTWKTIRRVQRSRKFRAHFAEVMAQQPPLPERYFEAAVYFADTPRNIYQLRQWYQPFEKLNEHHPVAIISRSMRTVLLVLEETTLPVAYCPTVADLENFVLSQRLGGVFYPNQNAKNFQMIRNHGPAHVWINHGESDKASMTTNQVKAYDKIFIAGDAAQERLERNVLEFDVAQSAVKIGRPQIDCVYEAPELPDDGRTVLFYSPTWEGDRPSMSYSSILSHAETIVRSAIESDTIRLIFRPHPSTGNIDPDYRQAISHLRELIEAANEADPNAHHLLDTSRQFGWQLGVSDYCVADVSAVAFDWLATGKPIYITEPASEEVFLETEGLIASLPKLRAESAGDILELFSHYSERPEAETLASLAAFYFGDTTPGSSMQRWIEAAGSVIEDRLSLLESRGALLPAINSAQALRAADASEEPEAKPE